MLGTLSTMYISGVVLHTKSRYTGYFSKPSICDDIFIIILLRYLSQYFAYKKKLSIMILKWKTNLKINVSLVLVFMVLTMMISIDLEFIVTHENTMPFTFVYRKQIYKHALYLSCERAQRYQLSVQKSEWYSIIIYKKWNYL